MQARSQAKGFIMEERQGTGTEQGAPVVHSIALAFVTIEMREIDPARLWHIYSVSEKRGARFVGSATSLARAYALCEQERANLTERIQRKRKGRPTPRQLATLFSLHIPIPLTLTWGQASDMIDAALTERKNERRARAQFAAMKGEHA